MEAPSRESEFFTAVASRQIPRIRVAAIVIQNQELLVQKPTDDPTACFALIGGEYEFGDTFESRIRKEFEEETNAKVASAKYLFTVENSFIYGGKLIQAVEHYLEVAIDRYDVQSHERHLTQQWLPLSSLASVDLRPHAVRDVIAHGTFREIRHLLVHP